MLRLHVDVVGDVELEQFVLVAIAQHAHQRRVCGHELAVDGGLEHPGGHVLEQLAIALLRRLQRQHGVRALGRVAQHALDQRRRQVIAQQEIERAARNRVRAQVLGAVLDQHHDRHVGGLGLDAQERRQAAAVRQRKVEQDGVDASVLDAVEGVGQGRGDLQPVRLAADRAQGIGEPGLVGRLGADEQDGRCRHVASSIRRVRPPKL